MSSDKFATSISCMDGRIQTALSEWIRENYKVDYVDTITAPGADRRVAEKDNIEPLFEMARISVQKHGSRLIVISGHHDCAGNPVSAAEHKDHIKSGVSVAESLKGQMVENENDEIQIVGVWVDGAWAVQRIL